MHNFDFFYKKGTGVASPPHIVYDYSRKTFLMLYSMTSILLSEVNKVSKVK